MGLEILPAWLFKQDTNSAKGYFRVIWMGRGLVALQKNSWCKGCLNMVNYI